MKTASRFVLGSFRLRSAWIFSFAFTLLQPTLRAAEENARDANFLHAVKVGDEAGWSSALDAKIAARARDAAGNTALHFAAMNHDVPAVTALLQAGAEVDAQNAAGATPLLYGAGHAGIVRALLARGASPNAASNLQVTPLMAAAAHADSFDVVRLLIDAGADVRAIINSDVEVVLSRAVSGGDRRTVELLLSRGAAKDPKSAAAALSTAALNGEFELVQMLVAQGADPNLNPVFAGHALNQALLNGFVDTARFLIEKGAELNVRSPRGHNTPTMMFAAYNQAGDASIARMLVARGVDVNVANEHGATALSWAQRNGAHTPIVEYLQSVGANSPEPTRAKRVPDRAPPADPAARQALVRERLPATIALLQHSSTVFLENGFVQRTGCTSCHGQDLPAAVYGLARERGFTIDEPGLGRQLATLTKRWNERAENARQMLAPVPGSPVSLGYGMLGLRGAGYRADETTDAMVRYVLRTQRSDGSWNDSTRRPPMEDGSYVATGWVALMVRDFAPAGVKNLAAESQAKSARWLAAHGPSNTNEAIMQLLGLHWSGVTADRAQASVSRVVGSQRADGGWAQLPGLESDAWATGSALYALHKGGEMPVTNPVYQRGVAFLLRTQFEDGSWWVRGRSWPFQPHFNGQFPHGKDQWISQGASAWAAMALLLTLEPVKPAAPAFVAQDLIATYLKSPAAKRRGDETTVATNAAGTTTVDFARDVQPLFKRSCAGCHSGEKPRAAFALTSRESLLKGGASGEPAITPGYSDDSTLIQYVTGKIEDLEMPPLDRREKYPALTNAEIDVLRAWIDAGAPWSVTESAKPKATAVLE
jgi:ankyrin repeat protein